MLVPVLRPLTLGEVLDTSLAIYRRLFPQLLVVSVATQSVPLAVSVYVESAGGPLQQPALWTLSVGLAVVFGAVGTAASTFLVAETYLGERLPTQEAFLRSTPFFGRLIGTSVLVSLLIALGLLFFILPGIIFACGLILSTPALVLEDIPRITEAMGRSWALTRGYRLKIFVALVVAFVLLLIPGAALSAFLGSRADSLGESTLVLVLMIVQSVLQILVYPLFYVVTTVLYYDLRVRKEGLDLEMLAASLQQG